MRPRRLLSAILVALAVGPVAVRTASAQTVPSLPDVPLEVPVGIPPDLPPLILPPLDAASPVFDLIAGPGRQYCKQVSDTLAVVGGLAALVPGVPVALPLIPVVGVYTVMGAVQGVVRPPLYSFCANFH